MWGNPRRQPYMFSILKVCLLLGDMVMELIT